LVKLDREKNVIQKRNTEEQRSKEVEDALKQLEHMNYIPKSPTRTSSKNRVDANGDLRNKTYIPKDLITFYLMETFEKILSEKGVDNIL